MSLSRTAEGKTYVPTSHLTGINSPLMEKPACRTSHHGAPTVCGDRRRVSMIHAYRYEQPERAEPETISSTAAEVMRISLATSR